MTRYRGSTVAFAAAYVVLVVGLFVALGGAAYAASPPSSANDQYSSKEPTVTIATETSSGNTAATNSSSLPYTGLSLVGVVVVAGALIAGGVFLRRRERRES